MQLALYGLYALHPGHSLGVFSFGKSRLQFNLQDETVARVQLQRMICDVLPVLAHAESIRLKDISLITLWENILIQQARGSFYSPISCYSMEVE